MTQFPTQSPVLPATQNDGATNAREIAGFVVSEIIKTIGMYALAFTGALSPPYVWAAHTGSHSLVLVVSAGMSVIWGAIVFVLFILFRALFDGVPDVVRNSGQETRRTTCGGEIGAFVLAYAIVLAVVLWISGVFLTQVYVALGRALAPLLGFGISLIAAASVFILFVALRRGFISR